MALRCGVFLGVLLLGLCPHLYAQARPKHDARTDRLIGLRSAELERLAPHLARGPVALVGFADKQVDELPAINVALLIHAPAAEVAALIQKPGSYPKFMRTVDRVKVVSSQGNTQVYDWVWEVALFRLGGRNVMRVYEPTASRPNAGYRITIDSQSGDFGTGRIVMRVLPRGAHRSLLVLSMRLDLRRSNYVARQVAKAARSVNRSANMCLAFAMSLSFRREAERRAGYTPPRSAVRDLYKPHIDVRGILPLLARGDLVLLDMSGDRLDQLAVFARIDQRHALVREVMLDADAFGSALVPGSGATVLSRKSGVTIFDWEIDIPLLGVSGQMEMLEGDPVVSIRATKCALQGGDWRFEASALSKRVTMVAGWARFDLRKSSWLLRQIMDADPFLGHGMTAASEVMLVRALRKRSRKAQEALQAANVP